MGNNSYCLFKCTDGLVVQKCLTLYFLQKRKESPVDDEGWSMYM